MDDSSWLNARFDANMDVDEPPSRPGDQPQDSPLVAIVVVPNRVGHRPQSNPTGESFDAQGSTGERPHYDPLEEILNGRRRPENELQRDPIVELFNGRRPASSRQELLGRSFVESMRRGRGYARRGRDHALGDFLNRSDLGHRNLLFGLFRRPGAQPWPELLNDHESDDSDDDEPSLRSFLEFLNVRQDPNAEILRELLHRNRRTRQRRPLFRSCPLHGPMAFHEPLNRPRYNEFPDGINSVNGNGDHPRENPSASVNLMSMIHFQNPKTVNIMVFLMSIVAMSVSPTK